MAICKRCYAIKPFEIICLICNGYKHNKKKENEIWRLRNYKKFKRFQNNYYKKRCKEDVLFRLRGTLRAHLNGLIRRKSLPRKKGSILEYIGCSLTELRDHLEDQFKSGMSWGNYGEWHIDHIMPVCTARSEKDLYKLYSYENLQPLWADENLAKKDKIYHIQEISSKGLQ